MDRNYIIDMLKGQINRMCVCKDTDELENDYEWATLWLEKLYDLNKERVNDEHN